MKREDLNKWAFPHDKLPRKLFFVHHSGSQCRFIEEREREEDCPDDVSIDEWSLSIMGGITAASPGGIIGCIDDLTNIAEIYRKIKRRLDWSNRRPSCFVSTFSDGNDVLRWALQLDGTVKIYTVDTSTTSLPPMPMVHVFRPSDFNVNWPENEYLFFHQIPSCAVEAFTVISHDYKSIVKYSCSAPSLPQSMNDSSPDLGPPRKSDKRKREEDAVSSRNTRLRTNTGKAIGPTATSEGGDGEM